MPFAKTRLSETARFLRDLDSIADSAVIASTTSDVMPALLCSKRSSQAYL